MRWKSVFVLPLIVLALVCAAWLLNRNLRESEKPLPAETDIETTAISESKEITIRNVTSETVHYRIKPAYSQGKAESRVLEAAIIDRFNSHVPMDVTYPSQGKTKSYRLRPGTPYSFRYDANHNLALYEGSHGRIDAEDLAPYVPTPMAVVEKMLELAGVGEKDILYDLGCGDGRIVIMAAKKYACRGVGIDLDPLRIEESNTGAREARVENLVKFRLQDATKADFSEATVVTLYLLPESNRLLRPLLEAQLKPGTRVVSHDYSIPGWEAKEINYTVIQDEEGEEHTIYLYRL